MKKIEYTFTDGKGSFYSCMANDSDNGENKAYSEAKAEISKHEGIGIKIKLYSMQDK